MAPRVEDDSAPQENWGNVKCWASCFEKFVLGELQATVHINTAHIYHVRLVAAKGTHDREVRHQFEKGKMALRCEDPCRCQHESLAASEWFRRHGDLSKKDFYVRIFPECPCEPGCSLEDIYASNPEYEPPNIEGINTLIRGDPMPIVWARTDCHPFWPAVLRPRGKPPRCKCDVSLTGPGSIYVDYLPWDTTHEHDHLPKDRLRPFTPTYQHYESIGLAYYVFEPDQRNKFSRAVVEATNQLNNSIARNKNQRPRSPLHNPPSFSTPYSPESSLALHSSDDEPLKPEQEKHFQFRQQPKNGRLGRGRKRSFDDSEERENGYGRKRKRSIETRESPVVGGGGRWEGGKGKGKQPMAGEAAVGNGGTGEKRRGGRKITPKRNKPTNEKQREESVGVSSKPVLAKPSTKTPRFMCLKQEMSGDEGDRNRNGEDVSAYTEEGGRREDGDGGANRENGVERQQAEGDGRSEGEGDGQVGFGVDMDGEKRGDEQTDRHTEENTERRTVGEIYGRQGEKEGGDGGERQQEEGQEGGVAVVLAVDGPGEGLKDLMVETQVEGLHDDLLSPSMGHSHGHMDDDFLSAPNLIGRRSPNQPPPVPRNWHEGLVVGGNYFHGFPSLLPVNVDSPEAFCNVTQHRNQQEKVRELVRYAFDQGLTTIPRETITTHTGSKEVVPWNTSANREMTSDELIGWLIDALIPRNSVRPADVSAAHTV